MKILSKNLLKNLKKIINIHPSFPKYKGLNTFSKVF